MSTQWKPFDTAPKDGRVFFIWQAGYEWPEVVRWVDYDADEQEETGEEGYFTYAETLLSETFDPIELGEPWVWADIVVPTEEALVMTTIDWGPEIKVDGKRPDWLNDGEQFQAGGGPYEWFGLMSVGSPHIWNRGANGEPLWSSVDRIRLPANHPHYAQQTPTPAVVGSSEQTEVLSVLVEALSAMVYEVTHGDHDCTVTADTLNEARGALLRARALLPVDPIEAIVDELMRKDCTTRQAITEAVYRGRALAAGDRS